MTHKPSQPSLFDRSPPYQQIQIITFPLNKRIGRVRDVAWKLFNKPTQKAANYYRRQTTEFFIVQLSKLGQPPEQIKSELTAFWDEVNQEFVRLE